MEDGADPFLVEGAQSRGAQSERDISIFLGDPQFFSLEVGEESAVGAPCNFQADPFLFLRDPAEGIFSARRGSFSSDDTSSRHSRSYFK